MNRLLLGIYSRRLITLYVPKYPIKSSIYYHISNRCGSGIIIYLLATDDETHLF